MDYFEGGEPESWFTIICRIIFFLILVYFFTQLLFPEYPWIFLDGVNLLVHEAGHLLFAFGGETISFLGGTITQLLLPLIFLIYFLRRREYFSSSFILFWLGDNLVNVGWYIKDANTMVIPLVGGGIHDWNFLLGKYGWLPYDQMIGNAVYYPGLLLSLVALIIMVLIIVRKVQITFLL